MSIEVRNISKYYDRQKALDKVSFKVNTGEIIGFLGPNGAGKSTLMKILTGYLQPSMGEAKVCGHSVLNDRLKVQREIGYLSEQNPLYTDQFVREYLKFHAKIHKIPAAAIEKVIEQTGLLPEANKKVEQLSKGYQQRLGLAAALLHDPSVLIMDEPTTGLDPNQLSEIRELIKTIGREKTVFLSTHIMREVEAICDRVIIIDNGKIVGDRYLKDLREANEQVVFVEFDFRVERVALERIEHVKHVSNPKGFEYELTFEARDDMRSTVFDFAHDSGLKILQLHTKNKNLEELFRSLTRGETQKE